MGITVQKIASGLLQDSKQKVDQCKQCAYWSGGDMSKCIPRMTTDAATALSMLQAENKRLNKIVCSIPTTPDSGRTVSQYDKEMSMCAYLDDLEAENEKIRAELEYEKEHANAYYEECGQWEAENTQLRAELEQVKRENETLKQFLQNWHEVEED